MAHPNTVIVPLSIPVGGGWVAIRAQFDVGSSSIALVTLSDKQHQEHSTRVDLDKRMVIDPITPTIPIDRLEKIADAVVAKRFS